MVTVWDHLSLNWFFKVIEGSHFKDRKLKMLLTPSAGASVTSEDEFLETQQVVLTREGGWWWLESNGRLQGYNWTTHTAQGRPPVKAIQPQLAIVPMSKVPAWNLLGEFFFFFAFLNFNAHANILSWNRVWDFFFLKKNIKVKIQWTQT